MKIYKQSYCNDCGDLVEFTITDEDITEEFHDQTITYNFSVGRCKVCGCEVSTDLDYNCRKSDAKWKALKLLEVE